MVFYFGNRTPLYKTAKLNKIPKSRFQKSHFQKSHFSVLMSAIAFLISPQDPSQATARATERTQERAIRLERINSRLEKLARAQQVPNYVLWHPDKGQVTLSDNARASPHLRPPVDFDHAAICFDHAGRAHRSVHGPVWVWAPLSAANLPDLNLDPPQTDLDAMLRAASLAALAHHKLLAGLEPPRDRLRHALLLRQTPSGLHVTYFAPRAVDAWLCNEFITAFELESLDADALAARILRLAPAD